MQVVDWGKLWKSKEHNLQLKHLQALELLNKLLQTVDVSNLCDFGCGQGILLEQIKKNIPDIKLVGSDNNEFSKEAIEKLGIKYKNFNLEKDKNDEVIDLAILTDVLEHFYDPQVVLNNLSNIPYLIVVVPNFSFVTERISALKGEVPFQLKPSRGGHFFWFNKKTLSNLISNSNYEIVVEYNVFPNKINKFPILKKYDNLFTTSFGVLLKNKNIVRKNEKI